MKKLSIVFMLLLALVLLMACNGETTTATTTDTAPTTTKEPSSPTMPEGEKLVTENYTATLNAEKWTGSTVDTSSYDLVGVGGSLYSQATSKYAKYSRTFITVDENGNETALTALNVAKTLRSMGLCGATVTLNEAKKTATIKVSSLEGAKVLSSWAALTAKAGTYVMFEFYTNLPMTYAVTVTETPGGAQTSAAYTQDGITVSGKDGKYTGTAKCTVPYEQGKTYYINICAEGSGYPVFASVPVEITAPKYDLPFQFIFQGDWDMVEDKSYIDNLYEVLYNSYPRAYKRWAMNGDEPTVLYVVADRNYDGVAYNAGTTVCVSTDYANRAPEDVGLFAHEFTHAIQNSYGIEYSNGWFTEAMADYGRLRFFHWGYSVHYIKEFDPKNEDTRDFRTDKSDPTSRWHQYQKHSFFMAYLDDKWPTTDKNGDGKITPDEHGLIDHIVYEAKQRKKNGLSNVDDYPYTEGSVFNNWVKDVTGIATMELVRQQYVKELDDGTWTFIGFRDYQDNFLIENCWDLPNLMYPMVEEIKPTGKTNPVLAAAMTTGDNLCKDAVVRSSVAVTSSNYPMANLIDGDLTTRFQTDRSEGLYKISGIHNEIVIDLGAVKTFDTYTLCCYDKPTTFIAKSWEILVSTDGSTYTAIDYQEGNTTANVSVSFDDVSARYVKIRLFKADTSGGKTRLNEFMLFDANP